MRFLVVVMSIAKHITENCATNFMQPNCILCIYVFWCNPTWNLVGITPMFLHGFDVSHAFRSHKGLPVIMKVRLSCAMTAIVILA